MILYIVLGILSLVLGGMLCWFIRLVIKAPMGYETDTVFKYGEEEDNP